jgi:hypothetical protein
MSRCNRCKIEVRDDIEICPLCKCVLEKTENVGNTYPNVRISTKKINLIIRIYIFLAILAEVLLVFINYKTFKETYWSVITGGALLYILIVLKSVFEDSMEYRRKSIIPVITGILYVILIDIMTGFHGWSLNYVLPGGIMLVNTAIIFIMLINSRNWQSYLLFQMITILWSIVPFILYKIGIITYIMVSLVALAYSVFLFLGTMIIGGRRAETELKRRFHVR